jgi:hypothetical protein
MLSAYEIRRFSADQAAMRSRHVGLYRDRTVIALRDHRPERNLWELVQAGGEGRLTRIPKLRAASFDGPAGNRFSARIAPALFETVVEAHRTAIIQMIRSQVGQLAEERVRAANAGARHDLKLAEDRLKEVMAGAARLLPEDFAR